MSNLIEHAKKELLLAGLFDKDSDYDGMLGKAVLELVEVFSKQEHSGFSAHQTLKLFNIVADFKSIMPIGTTNDEWMDVGDKLWQNKRRSSTFSRDNGKTWYDIDDESLNNGDVWQKTNIDSAMNTMARNKAKLLVKLINNLSFQLGHPKDDLVKIIKTMIEGGKL